jgi:hypothetical protein
MFQEPIEELSANLESQRDFVALLEAFLTERTQDTYRTYHKHMGPLVSLVKKSGIVNLSEEELLQIGDEEVDHSGITISTVEKNGELNYKIEFGEHQYQTAIALLEIKRAQNRIPLLYKSSLMNLTSNVELFFSQLLHIYFHKHPETIIVKDKIFSFSDLTEFKTIDDARQHYISSRIEELFYKSFTDWIALLKEKPKLSMSYVDNDLAHLQETFLRRNLFVHNGGIVNSVYLSKCSTELASGISIGDRIEINKDYLDERVSLFEKNCILIAVELWKKMLPEDIKRANTILSISSAHMEQKRWEIAESLSYFLMNDKQMPETSIMMGKIHFWLSKKRQGKWNEIKSEVESIDFSAKSLKFQLFLSSLKEDADVFFNLVPKAIGADEINIQKLIKSPIFEEMRMDVRFSAYSKEN